MWKEINNIEKQVSTPKGISVLRYEYLKSSKNNGAGFAAAFVPILRKAVDEWLVSLKVKKYVVGNTSCGNEIVSVEEEKKTDSTPPLFRVYNTKETKYLYRILAIHSEIATLDPTLAEELGKQGSHIILTKVLKEDPIQFCDCEEDQDTIMELQDLACEVAASSQSFPLQFAPFTQGELKSRLPVIIPFEIGKYENNIVSPIEGGDRKEEIEIIIQQITARQGAQEDVGFVLWPSSMVLARWLMYNQDLIQNKSVLELGAGCGLVGLFAAQLLQRDRGGSIILSDFNPKVIENLKRNIELNECNRNKTRVTAQMLDFYHQSGNSEIGWIDANQPNTRQPLVDLILAADCICQPSDASATANTIYDALSVGGKAIVVCADSKHRFGVDCFKSECQRAGLVIEISDVADLYDGNLIDHKMFMTTGYVEGMSMKIFMIEKLEHKK